MNWKPSKRQAQLKKRLVDSSQVYWSTSRILDKMLIKMLHSEGIFTPDDLYDRYIDHKGSRNNFKRIKKYREPKLLGNSNDTTSQINQTLKNLNQVLIQLKDIINKMSRND